VTVLVLLGAPGAGKGTQAPIMAERLGIPHIATGDMFRAAVREDTDIGREAAAYMSRGELVPDLITVRMLLERLGRPDAAAGAVLDGYPRNREQAAALDDALVARGARVDRAISIDVPADELVRRLSGRWTCRADGHVYHDVSHPPRTPGVCDVDGSALYQRDDDRVETIRARLAQQLNALGDVIAYYRDRGILGTVDGLLPIDVVTEELVAQVASLPRSA
jgi:adenylate kinase